VDVAIRRKGLARKLKKRMTMLAVASSIIYFSMERESAATCGAFLFRQHSRRSRRFSALSILPEILETVRSQLGVDGCVLDIAVPEV